MPTGRPVYQGDATAVVGIQTITKGDAPADTAVVYTITAKNRQGQTNKVTTASTVADTSTSAVCSAIATALQAAKTAGDQPWDEVTAETTTSTALVRITSDSAGVPFFITALASNETATLTSALVTAVGGPSIYHDPDNWDTDSAPIDNDIPVFPANLAVNVYGEDFDSAVTLLGMVVEAGCSAIIASQERLLTCNFATNALLSLDGTGEVYVRLGHADTTLCDSATINVTGAGAGSATGTYGINIQGADTTVSAFVSAEAGQTVSFGARSGDSCDLKEIKAAGGDVYIGPTVGSGLSGIPLTVTSGTVFSSAITGVLTQDGGEITHGGSATMTSANVTVGTLIYKSSGTLSSGTIGGTLDFSQDLQARVVDSSKGLTLLKGATVLDPHETIGTTVLKLGDGVGLEDVTLQIGKGPTIKKT